MSGFQSFALSTSSSSYSRLHEFREPLLFPTYGHPLLLSAYEFEARCLSYFSTHEFRKRPSCSSYSRLREFRVPSPSCSSYSRLHEFGVPPILDQQVRSGPRFQLMVPTSVLTHSSFSPYLTHRLIRLTDPSDSQILDASLPAYRNFRLTVSLRLTDPSDARILPTLRILPTHGPFQRTDSSDSRDQSDSRILAPRGVPLTASPGTLWTFVRLLFANKASD